MMVGSHAYGIDLKCLNMPWANTDTNLRQEEQPHSIDLELLIMGSPEYIKTSWIYDKVRLKHGPNLSCKKGDAFRGTLLKQ